MSHISIKKLCEISTKGERLILGCLSGTSMDGLDIGCCRIMGSGRTTQITLEYFSTITFPFELKQAIKKQAFNQMQDMEAVTRLNTALGLWIGESILLQLSKWELSLEDIDAIASHGQTLYHAPSQRKAECSGTFQIGDADQIARLTGKIVVSDFRQKHISVGGEGAPLTPYLDWIVATSKIACRVLINIGGIANVTIIPANSSFESVIYGDSGPGNTLIDRYCERKFNIPYDTSGSLAQSGNLHHKLFEKLKSMAYFEKPLPKTTGQEAFSLEWLDACLKEVAAYESIKPEDILTTLTHLTAWSIAELVKPLIKNRNNELFISGGGANNTFLIELLEDYLGEKVFLTDKIGLPCDAKESMLFALLANETLSGKGFPAPNGNGRITFGKISLPN